ncbi:hypothetical protein ACPTIE_30300, partial [Pseudomonas aeruginosa]|uniref:hypothetical protein n=1 Tax=Pseudomonas aeruginosa TaxID=287 RepID=UPI003CC5ADAB
KGTLLVILGKPDFYMGFNIPLYGFSAVIDCGNNNQLCNLCLILTKKIFESHSEAEEKNFTCLIEAW